jgi:hypothetical protein
MYPYHTYMPPYPYQPQSQFPPNYRAPYGYQQAPVTGGPYSAYAPTYPGHVSPSFDETYAQDFEGSYQSRSGSPPLGSQTQGLNDQPNSPPPSDGRQGGPGSDNGTESHQGLSPSQGSTPSASITGGDGATGHGHYGFGSTQLSQQATGSQIPMQLGQQPFSFLPHHQQQQQLLYQGHDRYNWT